MNIKHIPKESGVYEITCRNKRYIGFSSNIRQRLLNHISELNRNKHPNSCMQIDWLQYKGSFCCSVIEITTDKTKEDYWTKFFEAHISGYNEYCGIIPTSALVEQRRQKLIGHSVSRETREKLRQHNLGKASPTKGMIFGEASREKRRVVHSLKGALERQKYYLEKGLEVTSPLLKEIEKLKQRYEELYGYKYSKCE